MGIFEEMMAEHLAIQAEREAIEAERLYLTKSIELIGMIIAAKDLGISSETLDQAGMYLSEQAFRMEQEVDKENTAKLRAGDEWDTSRGELCLEDHPSLGLTRINHSHPNRKEV